MEERTNSIISRLIAVHVWKTVLATFEPLIVINRREIYRFTAALTLVSLYYVLLSGSE